MFAMHKTFEKNQQHMFKRESFRKQLISQGGEQLALTSIIDTILADGLAIVRGRGVISFNKKTNKGQFQLVGADPVNYRIQ